MVASRPETLHTPANLDADTALDAQAIAFVRTNQSVAGDDAMSFLLREKRKSLRGGKDFSRSDDDLSSETSNVWSHTTRPVTKR